MNAIANMARLTKAGVKLGWSGARVLPEHVNLPGPLGLFSRATSPLRKNGAATGNQVRLSKALTSLGPSYIKLGQFLATRDDLIGRELARDLSTLQDRLPPFSQDEAVKAVEAELEAPLAGSDRALALGRLAAAALLVGAGRILIERAAERARTRQQFGRPIGSHQAVSHPLADCSIRLSAAEGVLRSAAWAMWPTSAVRRASGTRTRDA